MHNVDLGGLIENKKVEDSRKAVIDLYNAMQFDKKDYPLVEAAFAEWLEDTSYIELYKNRDLVTPNKLIIRLFCFEKERPRYTGKVLLGVDGEAPLTQTMILPYARVIKVSKPYGSHEPRFKVGDVICCQDNIAEVVVRDEWIAWRARMDKERPQINTPEPEKLGGKLLEWIPSRLVLNKLNPTKDDNWTFVRDQSEFDMIYKRDEA